jgi:hypothetical protein
MFRATIIECRLRPPAVVTSTTMADFARLINSFLPAEQAVAVWDKLQSSPCKSSLGATGLLWLRLHAAVAARKPAGMADAAAAILEATPDLPSESKAFVLAALMAGHTLAGQPNLAAKAFQRHRGSLRASPDWQPIFSFLTAHALGPIGGAPSAGADNN